MFLDWTMSKYSSKNDCPICDFSLQTNEATVKTECGHIFHRICAQKRLDEKYESDCKVCNTPSALANVLGRRETTNTTGPIASRGSKPVERVCLLFLI